MTLNVKVNQDIFKSSAQTLINTVNCTGVMGKGIALEFKKRFPEMYEDYTSKCKNGEVKLGKPYLYKRMVRPWILLFPTKDDWRSVSKLTDIENGLKYLLSKYKEWGIESIAVPPLGCGLGGLEWRVVGITLYRNLSKMDIPVELYAPFETPLSQTTREFLESNALNGASNGTKVPASKIEPGFISIVEALRRLEQNPYRHPVGRTMLQKICYFGTVLGLKTNLEYYRGSYGPFSQELKPKIPQMVNNGLISEAKVGRMIKYTIGRTFNDARESFRSEIKSNEGTIEKLVDLFSRLDTRRSELAATVYFVWSEKHSKSKSKISEIDVINDVMEWKQRRKPPFDKLEVAKMARNLAILKWIDIEPSDALPKDIKSKVEEELEV